jgi:AAA15 family ATPase/GTPase
MQEIEKNKNISYWHIQLHPNQINWNQERELLETTSLIGLGLLEKGNSQIKNFKNVMKIGDIVLVKRGSTPIALVEVIGNYKFNRNQNQALDWFEHRREIKVLDYATDDMPHFPQPRGRLQKAINKNTASYKYIDDWYRVPLIKLYKNSQYANQLDDSKTQLLRQPFKYYELKKWLGGDDALNILHLEKLFAWISISDKRKSPILKNIEDISKLKEFINDKKALEKMEETEDVLDGLKRMYITKSLEGLKGADKYLVRDDIDILKKLLPKDSSLDIQNENVSICFSKGKIKYFDSLFIEQYKIFKDFKIEKLNRINIFAGFNNTGKTTLLEAIYLLTKQNNIEAYFKYVKLKNKLTQLDINYMKEYFKQDIKISGKFNEIDTSIHIKKFFASNIDKKDDYSVSYEAISVIDGEAINNTIHTFEVNPLIRYVDKVELLCNSIFKSPYFYNKNEIVETYSKSLKSGEIDETITFIQKHIDSNIMGISHDGIDAFIVKHKIPTSSPELTSYGEGLQRIFEIALSFANCRNGVLLIDELETAIHYSLLVDFSKFIQELAVKFNVQVFITTHSKECIGAFVENGVHNKDINFYTMLRGEDNQIETITYNDEALINELDKI